MHMHGSMTLRCFALCSNKLTRSVLTALTLVHSTLWQKRKVATTLMWHVSRLFVIPLRANFPLEWLWGRGSAAILRGHSVCVCVCACARMCMCACSHVHVCVLACSCVRACVQACMCVCVHTYMCMFVYEVSMSEWETGIARARVQGYRYIVWIFTPGRRMRKDDVGRALSRLDVSRLLCFICGPPPMIEDIQILLRDLGVGSDCIHIEKWWWQLYSA